jgi:hypothetical protein
LNNDRWSRPRNPFAPDEGKGKNFGVRPSVARLIEKLDPESENFTRSVAVLAEMASAGVEIDEAAVGIAIKLAAQKQSRDTEVVAASRELAPQPLRLWGEQGGRESIVYYIRRGDLIKIGTTTNPKRRFESLVPDEILAWEPGGTIEEALRHRKFRRLKQGLGEYFRIEPDLLGHCKRLRKLHGDPDPRWSTTATVGRREHRRAPLPSEMPLPESAELVTAVEAAARTDVKSATIRAWIARKRLVSVAADDAGRMLFFLDHVRFLKSQSRAYRDTA